MTDVITDRPANDRKDFLFDAVTIPQSQKELGCHMGRLILVSAPHPRKQPTQAKLSDPIEIQHDTILPLEKIGKSMVGQPCRKPLVKVEDTGLIYNSLCSSSRIHNGIAA